ncbi:hypothetical protein GLW08_02135 [Pontibacillus yanchengensis]|uniref:Uncharacterized protein n=2 Tax=Pontibacillus yanchengensis TaxID=462910 RepID=A0ACC7VBT4_9BACI|nr:YlbE-like family protein [Pontibacillus yanchengensis]MYL33018.1 hypothetical protein [Pontibacillus yanchengensis]MYL52132.1 hypothetical protein [Pontibacillus yanchengensis]
MQPGVYQYLESREDLRKFMRMNPKWYRRVTRDPSVLSQMEQESKYYFGKTTTQRIERFNNQLQMVQMLMQMAQAMKD